MRIRAFILIFALLLMACGGDLPVTVDEPPVTNPITTTTPKVEITPSTTTTTDIVEQPIENPAVIEKIPLMNGVVLLVEHLSYNSTIVSIQASEDTEPIFLLGDWNFEKYRISPDLTKIAYIVHSDKYDSGYLNIFDVFENQNLLLEFDEYSNEDESKGMRWLDNEILLSIGLQSHYSWSSGGSVYYYNVADGSNKKIIPHDLSLFLIINIEIDNDELVLTILPNCGNAYATRLDDVYKSIPLTEIYELIENGKTLILNVPDMRSTE